MKPGISLSIRRRDKRPIEFTNRGILLDREPGFRNTHLQWRLSNVAGDTLRRLLTWVSP